MNRLVALLTAAAFALACAAPARAYTSEEQTELQIGQQEYQQLAQKGEIVGSSPYYNVLNPIAARIQPIRITPSVWWTADRAALRLIVANRYRDALDDALALDLREDRNQIEMQPARRGLGVDVLAR